MTEPPRKLAILLPSLHGGGAERVMLAVAGGVVSRGHPVDLVLTKAQGPYLAEVPEAVRLVDLEASRVVFSLPSLVRYLRRERPDTLLSVLHANLIAPLARRLAGVPTRVVLSIQNTLSLQTRYATDLRVGLEPRLLKLFGRWTDGIVAVSAGVADDLSQTNGIPRHLVHVVYNPIITPELKSRSQASLEHPWFGVGEPPVILAVGRLTAQKDFPTLIRAFARVRENRSARLLILGEGEERTSIEALVKRLGLEHDVSLPGFIVNPYPYMVRSSVFVLSSKWEGLPTVLVEALYCGGAVVSTDCPSGPREILRDGVYGQIVPVGDVAKIALSVENVLAGRAPRPPQDWWKPYELEAVVDRYLNVLFPDRAYHKEVLG